MTRWNLSRKLCMATLEFAMLTPQPTRNQGGDNG